MVISSIIAFFLGDFDKNIILLKFVLQELDWNSHFSKGRNRKMVTVPSLENRIWNETETEFLGSFSNPPAKLEGNRTGGLVAP